MLMIELVNGYCAIRLPDVDYDSSRLVDAAVELYFNTGKPNFASIGVVLSLGNLDVSIRARIINGVDRSNFSPLYLSSISESNNQRYAEKVHNESKNFDFIANKAMYITSTLIVESEIGSNPYAFEIAAHLLFSIIDKYLHGDEVSSELILQVLNQKRIFEAKDS